MGGLKAGMAKLNNASLLLLSILYMASLGLVLPCPVLAAPSPAGSLIQMGGDAGVPNLADTFGDVVITCTGGVSGATTYLTTVNQDVVSVAPIFGDTLASGTLTPASAVPTETAWITLLVMNHGNVADTIFFDSSAPVFLGLGSSALDSSRISFWNSYGTAPISSLELPPNYEGQFKVAVFLAASAPQGDTVAFTVTAKAKGGAMSGWDMDGYTGANGVSYGGRGNDTLSVVGGVGTVGSASISRVVFSNDTHSLAIGGSCMITVVVRNDTGVVVPNALVNFWIDHPISGGDADLSDDSPATGSNGRASTTITLGTQSSFYRVKAQVGTITQSFYAYNDRLAIPARDTATYGVGDGWRMWSPNKTPSTATVAAVIDADLGANATIYEWQATSGTNSSLSSSRYYEPSSIERGHAYWIKDNEGGILDVPGVADTTVTVPVDLDKGWNQIGSGQYFFVDWATGVQFFEASDTWDSRPLTPQQAKDSGLIRNAIYWYDEGIDNYRWGPDTMSIPTVQMKPMAGFWLYSETDGLTMKILPVPSAPPETTSSTFILNQAGRYLAASLNPQGQSTSGSSANDANWVVQLAARSGKAMDVQNYIGVMPTAQAAARSALFEPPSVASGYVTLGIRDPDQHGSPLAAAAYSAPITTAKTWTVDVYTDLAAPVSVTWDNVPAIPEKYEIILMSPSGPVNLRKASSIELPAAPGARVISMTLAVGLSQYVSAYLAPPLSKEVSFVYPNPGPDNTGIMNFTHNVTSGEVKIKIFDVGGRLVRELGGTTSPIPWDTTNRFGQKVGSGVYIYMMEADGVKLVDKLAVVR